MVTTATTNSRYKHWLEKFDRLALGEEVHFAWDQYREVKSASRIWMNMAKDNQTGKHLTMNKIRGFIWRDK